MIAIIDYGVGNLFSLKSSLSFLGLDTVVTSNENQIKAADKIILPGVGAFKDAIERLRNTGLVDPIKNEVKNGKPLLGICLGMQLLFDKSYEYGVHEGLSLISGDICPIKDDLKDKSLKVPHMGWNSLRFIQKDNVLLKDINEGDYVYYVHSYYAKNLGDSLVAASMYDVEIAGIVNNNNVYGIQFHPEKSGEVGLKILNNFGGI